MTEKTDPREQQMLRGEQVSMLYMQAPISNMVAIVIATVFYFLLYQDLGAVPTGTWAVLIVASSMSRFGLWTQHKSDPQSRDISTWLNDYTSLSAVFGLVWSGIYLMVPADAGLTTVGALAVLYFGVTAAAYSILTVHLPAYFLYTAPSLLTFSYMLSAYSELIHQLVIGTVWIFYLMLGLFARGANRTIQEMIRLKVHNAELVGRLREEIAQRDDVVEEQTAQLTAANQALRDSKAQLQYVISGANLGFWDWEYQTGYHEVNDRWLEMLGLEREDINNDVTDWADLIHPDDKDRMLAIVQEHIENHRSYVADFRMRHKDGHWVWIQGSGAVVEYDENDLPLRLCGIHQEISQRKSLEKQLEYQATHDPLTGLLNRGELWTRLEAELNRAERFNHPLALFMLDLDHFKQINDTHGHHVGDRVLQAFAQQLHGQLRKMDHCGRYGGEEFVVILPETGLEQATGMAERLRQLIASTDIHVDDLKVQMTTSIGLATYPETGQIGARLVDAADSALYRAKRNGRNRIETAPAGAAAP